MTHPHSILYTLLAALVCLLLAAGPGSAERIDYGRLWRDLTSAEKELLLIGYARGLKSAETKMSRAISNEAMNVESRRHLLETAARLGDGFFKPGDVKAAVEALDRLYAEPLNQYIDWTSLVGVALARLEGASDEEIERRLEFLRRCADTLEEVIQHQSGQ